MTTNTIMFDVTLPALVRVCYSALEDFSGDHRTCWPGYEAIAKKVGCTSRWIPVLLKRLVEANLLIIQYRQGRTNIYTLLGRVGRGKAVPAPSSPPPMKSDNYEQKPTTITNNNRAYRRLNGIKKGPIDFTKYGPGGKYEKLTAQPGI